MTDWVADYLLLGLVVSLGMALWNEHRGGRGTLGFGLMFDPFGLLIGILFWPVWLILDLAALFGERPPETPVPSAEGTVTAPSTARIGQRGTARTDLRPAGLADFGDGPVEVRAAEGFLRAGTELEVASVDDHGSLRVRARRG